MIVHNVRGTRSGELNAATLVVAAVFLLSGCASSAPRVPEANGASATPSVSSTPSPEAVVSAIVMSGSKLVSQTDAGQSVATVDFEQGPDAAVAFLTAALGAAPEQPPASDDAACRGPATASYAWGAAGDAAVVLTEWEPADSVGFVVTFRGPSFDGVALQSSGDFAVGDNAQEFFNQLPPDQALDEYDDDSGPFVYDKVADAAPWGEANPYGGVARMQPDGSVVAIVAPDTTRAFYC